jgi:hypothetical protein
MKASACSYLLPVYYTLLLRLNGAGKPLRRLDTLLQALRGIPTQTGLPVRAAWLGGPFEKVIV